VQDWKFELPDYKRVYKLTITVTSHSPPIKTSRYEYALVTSPNISLLQVRRSNVAYVGTAGGECCLFLVSLCTCITVSSFSLYGVTPQHVFETPLPRLVPGTECM
jgi:hypothetical protein